MAQRTYMQGFVKRVINLAEYGRKHQQKLQAAGLTVPLQQVLDDANQAEADARNLQNTYNP